MYKGFLCSLASGLARSRKTGKTAARPHGAQIQRTDEVHGARTHLVNRSVQPGRIQAPAFLDSACRRDTCNL